MGLIVFPLLLPSVTLSSLSSFVCDRSLPPLSHFISVPLVLLGCTSPCAQDAGFHSCRFLGCPLLLPLCYLEPNPALSSQPSFKCCTYFSKPRNVRALLHFWFVWIAARLQPGAAIPVHQAAGQQEMQHQRQSLNAG